MNQRLPHAAAEAAFRSLIGLSSDWYWEQDENLRFVARDEVSADKAPMRPSKFLGKTRWEAAGVAADDPAWAAHRAQLERRESFHDFEYGRLSADGVHRWVSVSGEPIFDHDGAFRGYRGVGRDITARKRAEEERARIARQYASLCALNELVTHAGSAQELLQGACEIAVSSGGFNIALVRMVDEASGQAPLVALAGRALPWVNRPLDLRDAPEDRESLAAVAYLTGKPTVATGAALTRRALLGRVVQDTGTRAVAAYPLRRGGICVGALLLNSGDEHAFEGQTGELLERMAANVSHGLESLEAAEALRRFRVALDHSADMVVLVDLATMRLVDVNDTLCRMLGYSRAELIGKPVHETVTTSREALEQAYDRLIADPSSTSSFRSEYRRRDGSLLPFESTRRVLRSGERWLMIGIARDIRERLAAEQQLRKQQAEIRSLAANSPDGILRIDADLRCSFVNAAVEKVTGRAAAEIVGRNFLEQPMPAEVNAIWDTAVREAFATGKVQSAEFSFAGPMGLRHYQARFAPERSPEGAVQSVLVISRDLTDRKRAERAVAESEARLRSIVEATAQPLLLVGPDGITLFANPAAAALFGRSTAALEGAPFGLPLTDGRPADVDILLPDGTILPAEMQFATTELQGREVLVVSLHDLSERKRYEAHIQHLATHDGLTGLPNRTLLRDRMEQAILHARRTQRHVALLFVDLDQFKLINDSFGHAVGDALLLEVGARLHRAVREGDTVARLGGDEFVILAPDLSTPGDSAVVARKIAAALARPVTLGEKNMPVSASIGIALFPGDGDDLDSLLQGADAAMYRAKDAGRGNYQYYSAEMAEHARARVQTESGLRQALERGELRLHYQPQVELATGQVTGFEALLRWEHPQRGLVSPASFIPVAEESGLIVPIGQWALREACRQASAWAAAGLGSLKIAVNLSARQFWQGSVTEAVRVALAESGLPAAQLEVEITESVVARDLQQVLNALTQLRRMGVSVAIDDFGTGYSSLAYLRSLPIQKLKIDRSFIQGIPADPEASALVAEIVRLAHVLSLDVVAEGVETQPQAAFLRDAACESMQGFVFSRPLPGADCAALLRARRRFVFNPIEPDADG